MTQPTRVQPCRKGRERHGGARVPGTGALDGVGGQEPDGIDRITLDSRRDRRVLSVAAGYDIVTQFAGQGGHAFSDT
jgi:hypothetical protein